MKIDIKKPNITSITVKKKKKSIFVKKTQKTIFVKKTQKNKNSSFKIIDFSSHKRMKLNLLNSDCDCC